MELLEFKYSNDGRIPNSRYPVLIYRNAFEERGEKGAEWLEKRFRENNWANSWRDGIYPYHHYHSITHEVLGVYEGKALLHLGGEEGEKVEVSAGDIIIIPAGVAHKNLGSDNLKVVGAYPNASEYDIKTGEKGERPEVDRNIAAVNIPEKDPLLGMDGGVPWIWFKYL